jgi:hypothetical protein
VIAGGRRAIKLSPPLLQSPGATRILDKKKFLLLQYRGTESDRDRENAAAGSRLLFRMTGLCALLHIFTNSIPDISSNCSNANVKKTVMVIF